MRTVLLILNLCASLISAAWAVAALVRPASLSGSSYISDGEIFYVRLYAARSIPLGLAAGIIPFWAGGGAAAWLLFTAAAVQVADVAIGMGKKARGCW